MGAARAPDARGEEGRGLHSPTFQLNLRSRHPTHPKHPLTPPSHELHNPYAHPQSHPRSHKKRSS
jgi:hypothetical protein